MADMANKLSKKSFVYDRLSFLLYDLACPWLDTEWLLSTLFDASLLSTSKAAGNGGSFFGVCCFCIFFPSSHRLETLKAVSTGPRPPGAQSFGAPKPARLQHHAL